MAVLRRGSVSPDILRSIIQGSQGRKPEAGTDEAAVERAAYWFAPRGLLGPLPYSVRTTAQGESPRKGGAGLPHQNE